MKSTPCSILGMSPVHHIATFFDHTRVYLTIFDNIWHYLTIFNLIQPYPISFDSIDIIGSRSPHSISFDSFQHFLGKFENMRKSDFIWHHSTFFFIIWNHLTPFDIMAQNLRIKKYHRRRNYVAVYSKGTIGVPLMVYENHDNKRHFFSLS